MTALQEADAVRRFWQKDPTLWKSDVASAEAITGFMGWLESPHSMVARIGQMHGFKRDLMKAGFTHILLMGMGGSSLAPLIFERSYGDSEGFKLVVLDSTDPGAVLMAERRVPLETTLFIVASKSGSTAEPNAFMDYFYGRVKEIKGDMTGQHFIAITDPETKMNMIAEERMFRRVIHNWAEIGGRYSALSYFGLLPATLAGLDVEEMMYRATDMLGACGPNERVQDNPGFSLGAAIGELALQGRDKLTFLVPEKFETLGLWLEQLIAESTGKEGKGILPIATERIGDLASYEDDRVFVNIRVATEGSADQDRFVDAAHKAGHPVITLDMASPLDLCSEFFRWEVATAVAGMVLGINPFDQPNVQESKDITNRILGEVEAKGMLPETAPDLEDGSVQVFGEVQGPDAASVLWDFVKMGKAGDYVAFMAYLTETEETEEALQDLRTLVRDRTKLATTLGYGPRFLHSTGQYHKGGPDTGLFVQITADHQEDAPIPGKPYTFGVFCDAQAAGDLEALRAHGRRTIRLNIKGNAAEGLRSLVSKLEGAM